MARRPNSNMFTDDELMASLRRLDRRETGAPRQERESNMYGARSGGRSSMDLLSPSSGRGRPGPSSSSSSGRGGSGSSSIRSLLSSSRPSSSSTGFSASSSSRLPPLPSLGLPPSMPRARTDPIPISRAPTRIGSSGYGFGSLEEEFDEHSGPAQSYQVDIFDNTSRKTAFLFHSSSSSAFIQLEYPKTFRSRFAILLGCSAVPGLSAASSHTSCQQQSQDCI